MDFFRILYWGLSYTAGIVCLTGLALRYLQLRDRPTLRLIYFLIPFGLSVVSLSMLEALSDHPVYKGISGCLALVGASLVIVSLPGFALLFDPTARRRKLNRVFRLSGWILALANILAFFLPSSPLSGLLQLATLLVLGFAVFTGMSWISRSRPNWGTKAPPVPMIALFLAFGLAFGLDLLRGFIPGLGFLGGRYIIFPGFYAFLNVFLFYSHVKIWAQSLREEAEKAGAPEANSLIGGGSAASSRIKRYGISEREAEVLSLLARGHTYREMADNLCLSLATIKTHVSHLYEKTGTRNKVELLNLTNPRIGHSADSESPAIESTK